MYCQDWKDRAKMIKEIDKEDLCEVCGKNRQYCVVKKDKSKELNEDNQKFVCLSCSLKEKDDNTKN